MFASCTAPCHRAHNTVLTVNFHPSINVAGIYYSFLICCKLANFSNERPSTYILWLECRVRMRMPRKNANATRYKKKVFIFPFSGRLSKAFHTVINNYDGIKSIKIMTIWRVMEMILDNENRQQLNASTWFTSNRKKLFSHTEQKRPIPSGFSFLS
jgi:hypothetical protein